jgi:hypothetical protein
MHPSSTLMRAAYGEGMDTCNAVAWQGITLVHRGRELGVVGHVTAAAEPRASILHAFGGVARSLEYAVPASGIDRVLGVSARAFVRDDLEFEPTRVCDDGTVILAPRATPSGSCAAVASGQAHPGRMIGMRVYADDGFLGEVDAVLVGLGEIDRPVFLHVDTRGWFGRRHGALVPVSRVFACDDEAGVLRLSGRRHELRELAVQGAHG